MGDKFTRIKFDNVIKIESVITFFYMEFTKDFEYSGEKHDFWEMVYIDQGEMLCTANENSFVLKSGEITFHKPNEFHNLKSNGVNPPNVSIITFESSSPEINYFASKIFKLSPDERSILSQLFNEGLSCFKMEDENNPLIQRMTIKIDAPFGSSQMTKNLLEMFLILLRRNKAIATKEQRQRLIIDGIAVSEHVKEVLDIVNSNIYGSISIKEICSKLCISESYLKKLFNQYYKGGIIHYYNSLKIKEAKKLLRENNLTITQISEALCFESPQYFSKCFKNATNKTPTQYKKSLIK